MVDSQKGMKKTLLVLGAWALAVLLIAVLVVSMGFSFAEALLIGVLFLPGALAARFFLSKISFKPRSEGIWNVTFVLLAILVAETALIVLANIYILRLRDIHPWDYDGFSPTLFNPVFLAGVLMLLVALLFAAWKAPAWVKEIGIAALVVSLISTAFSWYNAASALEMTGGEISPILLWGGIKCQLVLLIYGLLVYLVSLIIRVLRKPRL